MLALAAPAPRSPLIQPTIVTLASTTKRLVLSALVFVGVLTFLFQRSRSVAPQNTAMTSWNSEFEGWHARATPHPSPTEFVPKREDLAFAVLRNAPVDTDGFTVALFKPNVGVDALGRVIVVSEADFNGLASLAKQTLDLPQTGSFMNAWRIKQPRTSQPIERLFVPTGKDSLLETSVQGYEKGKMELKEPVNGITDLPAVLVELFGLVSEARDGWEPGKEDKNTIQKVKNVLGDV